MKCMPHWHKMPSVAGYRRIPINRILLETER
jgi:hypothetical protein